jgi:hypothetical protein
MAALDTATWISLLALVVSGLSFLAAMWAAWVSHRTLVHAKETHEEEQVLAFERERSELLSVISQSRTLLEQTRIRIGTLKARFDAAPQPAQTILQNYTNLFTEYLPRVEAGVRQCNASWSEVASWGETTGVQALLRHQARMRAAVHDDQIAHDQGVFLVDTFEEKFNEVLRYIAGATRSGG